MKIAHNQPTNYASKSRETYHTGNTESRETEREMRLKNYLQKQKSKLIEHSWRLIRKERLFLRRDVVATTRHKVQ